MNQIGLYSNSIENFKIDVMNHKIVDYLVESFVKTFGHQPNSFEVNSWKKSLVYLKEAIESAGLSKNWIILEYVLPFCSRRADAIIFGKDRNGNNTAVVIELKQWEPSHVRKSDNEGNVLVKFYNGWKEKPQPCLQVESYSDYIKDHIEVFRNKIKLDSIVYCHNYRKSKNDILCSYKCDDVSLFSYDDVQSLGNYLRERLSSDRGREIVDLLYKSKIKPSKELIKEAPKMLKEAKEIFTLVGDQLIAYNAIMQKIRDIYKKKVEKAVIIVKGGPGTGKSVIALEIMARLLNKNKKNVYYVTGSRAFKDVLSSLAGSRLRSHFGFFTLNYNKMWGSNSIDVLICDEAHRIRANSVKRYEKKSEYPQIEELIDVAKLSIFFVDEDQIIRPDEVGSISLIKETAKRLGIKTIEEFELKTQFRLSGSDEYLQWLDFVIGISEAELPISEVKELIKNSKMEFKIFNSPEELKRAIDEKRKEGKSARLVAGFCWPWSEPRADGTLVNDVKIGNFEMPWEPKDKFSKWSLPGSKYADKCIGTVYTVQGLEYDYMGVIFGNDLVIRNGKWVAKPENSYDRHINVKKYRDKIDWYLKRIYRVLMSRAHFGVYVYFLDEETRKYFEKFL